MPASRYIRAAAKPAETYRAPKIVVVKTGSGCIAALDRTGLVTMQSVYNLHGRGDATGCERLLAILNSRLVAFFIAKTFTTYKLLFPQLNQTTVQSIPVPAGRARIDGRLAALAGQMIQLHSDPAKTAAPRGEALLRRRIDTTDRQIDQLVYELYGLTAEEIAMVDSGVGNR